MTKDNKEALKSSLMTAVAFAVFVGLVLFLAKQPNVLLWGAASSVVGFAIGVLTTWYPEE